MRHFRSDVARDAERGVSSLYRPLAPAPDLDVNSGGDMPDTLEEAPGRTAIPALNVEAQDAHGSRGDKPGRTVPSEVKHRVED